MWITLGLLCLIIFFIIFAAKSKEHFQPKPLDIDPALLADEDTHTEKP